MANNTNNIRNSKSEIVVTSSSGVVTTNGGVNNSGSSTEAINLLATTTTVNDTNDYIPILDSVSGIIKKITKQNLVQSEVLYNTTALSGAVPVGKSLGINTSTGDYFFKNTNGNWQQQPVGTTVNLIDNSDGTLTISASLGGTQKTIRDFSELVPLVGTVDSVNDKIALFDASTSSHVYVTSSQIGVIPNVRYGSTVPTVLGTDKKGDEYLVTLTGNNTTEATNSYVFDGVIWAKRSAGTIPVVRYGTTIPTILSTDKTGDEYNITSSGTNLTTIEQTYIFDGNQWKQRPVGSNPVNQTDVGIVVGWTSNVAPPDHLIPLSGGTFNWSNYPDLLVVHGISPIQLISASNTTTFTVVDINTSGRFLRGGSTVGIVQSEGTKTPINPFTTGGAIANGQTMATTGNPSNGQYGLSQRSISGSNTATGVDASAGENNIINDMQNHYHNVVGGDAETRPLNISIIWCLKGKPTAVTGSVTINNLASNLSLPTFSYYEATSSAVQTGVTNSTAILFPVLNTSLGSNITQPTTSKFLLKSGGTYLVNSNMGYVSGSYGQFRIFNVTTNSYVGNAGHYEHTSSPGAFAGDGDISATITATTDTIIEVRLVSGGATLTIGSSIILPRIFITKLSGSSDFLPVNTITSKQLHSARLRRAVVQNIPNNISTSILFDTIDGNPNAIGLTGNANAITITQNGDYDITFRGGFDGTVSLTATTSIQLTIIKNGVVIGFVQDNGGIANVNYINNLNLTGIPLIVGDILQFNLFQNSGVAKNTSTVLGSQPIIEVYQRSTNVTALIQPLHVYSGIALPTIVPPTASPNDGDTYVQTSDGTVNGTLQASFIYSTTLGSWVKTGSESTQLATTNALRTYYPSTTALIEKWTTVQSAAQILAMGFTAVGGATIVNYGTYGGLNMIAVNSTKAAAATMFTIPTNYLMQELPISVGKNNTYFLKTLGDRETCLEVWICTALGVPIKRLAAKGVAHIVAGDRTSTQMSPLEAKNNCETYFEWLGFEIPESLISVYKTISNTLKVCIRPALNNGETNLWYLAGYAMAESSLGSSSVHCFNFDNMLNETDQTAANTLLAYSSYINGMAHFSLAANTFRTVRIPVVDLNKDIYLGVISIERVNDPNQDMLNCEFTLKHTSGDTVLGRPKMTIEPPLGKATLFPGSHLSRGFVITAATVLAKSVIPTNSGISYFELKVHNIGTNTCYGNGFFIENVT